MGFGETRGGDDRFSAHDGQRPGSRRARHVLRRTERCPATAALVGKPAFPSYRFLHDSSTAAVAYMKVRKVLVRSGDSSTDVVPSDHGFLKSSLTCSSSTILRRSLPKGGRKMYLHKASRPCSSLAPTLVAAH